MEWYSQDLRMNTFESITLLPLYSPLTTVVHQVLTILAGSSGLVTDYLLAYFSSWLSDRDTGKWRQLLPGPWSVKEGTFSIFRSTWQYTIQGEKQWLQVLDGWASPKHAYTWLTFKNDSDLRNEKEVNTKFQWFHIKSRHLGSDVFKENHLLHSYAKY
jgi:hypothetical protein